MALKYYGKEDPKVYGMVIGGYTTIVLRDLNMIEDLYIAKNKYFDKHDKTYFNF